MNQSEETSDDSEDPEISRWEAIIWLSILTAWVSLLSAYLVDAIEVNKYLLFFSVCVSYEGLQY